jgi:hypothetical protein
MPSEHSRPRSGKRSGKIPDAVGDSGISRSSLYKLAPKYPGLLRKLGSATLVDYEILDRVIDELPTAQTKAGDAA